MLSGKEFKNRPMARLIPLLLLICGFAAWAPASLAASAAQPDKPSAPYTLFGDKTNTTGTAPTYFVTNSGQASGGWQFQENYSGGQAIRATCNNGDGCTGVLAYAKSTGVYGYASDTTTGKKTYGVEGYISSGSNQAAAVAGIQSTAGVSSDGAGVYGWSNSSLGSGVYGKGTNVGVRGIATGTIGTGVVAYAPNVGLQASSTGPAGWAILASSSNAAAYGGASITSAHGDGVVASTGGDQFDPYLYGGVHGYCAGCNGVLGETETYIGVRGIAKSGTTSYGGYFSATQGIGIYGLSTSKYGVYGSSTSSYAVLGISSSSFGVYGKSNSSYGVYATTINGKVALRAVQPNVGAGNYAAVFDGDVQVNGNLTCSGACLAAMAVPTDKGDRQIYSTGATQSRFSDEGTATLKDGRAIVKIDALFAQTVDLPAGYQVFLTPVSFDTAGLAVGNENAGSFEVRELQGGKGNFSFHWKIEALRKGYSNLRLAPAQQAPAPEKADTN